MTLLDRMDKYEIKEMIHKCWITHDGMWFAQTLAIHGIEEANRLNRAAINAMIPFEIKRLLKILGLEKEDVRGFRGFRDFFLMVRDMVIPDFMNVLIQFEAPNIIGWQFTDRGCFAYNGVKRANVQAQYLCGPLYRIQCWLDYFEIDYEMTPDVTLCIMEKTGKCSGRFYLKG